jgi:hypothetical protein
MTGKRTELLAAVQFLWELARFLGLFALILLRFQRSLEDPAAVLWLVSLGSGQLLAPALLALFLYSPLRRATLLPFLRLAKILQVFPAALLALTLVHRQLRSALPFLPPRLMVAAAVTAATVLDLVFLLLLFTVPAGGPLPPDSGLPAPAGPPAEEP